RKSAQRRAIARLTGEEGRKNRTKVPRVRKRILSIGTGGHADDKKRHGCDMRRKTRLVARRDFVETVGSPQITFRKKVKTARRFTMNLNQALLNRMLLEVWRVALLFGLACVVAVG